MRSHRTPPFVGDPQSSVAARDVVLRAERNVILAVGHEGVRRLDDFLLDLGRRDGCCHDIWEQVSKE